MAAIGVRELKARASEIIRAVRDQRARYLVTYRGRPVGVLLPLADTEGAVAPAEGDGHSVWDELVALGLEISRGWQADASGVDLLSDMRR